MSEKKLFKDFEAISKSGWREKVIAELKGKPIDSLDWDMSGIRLSPFYHQEDQPENPQPISKSKENNQWQIGARIIVADPVIANKEAMKSLMGGATALQFVIPNTESIDPEILFKDIQHEWISTHLIIEKSPDTITWLLQLKSTIKSKGQDPSKINGSVVLNEEFEGFWNVYTVIGKAFPLFKSIILKEEMTPDSSMALSGMLEQSIEMLQEGQLHGYQLQELLDRVQLVMAVGDHYYASICKLRAIRLLWANLMHAYGIKESSAIQIECNLSSADQTDDPNYNMIKNTSQTMSAVIGGADIIYTAPQEFKHEVDDLGIRISRNISHVLQLESYMDRVEDPAAGSYFFETATDLLCQQAWQLFQSNQAS